jgi:hypothetical protein
MTRKETLKTSTTIKRSSLLLTEAALTLSNGCDPFHESFLIEHDVTLDECFDMSSQMALAIMLFLANHDAMKSPFVPTRQLAMHNLVDATTRLLALEGERRDESPQEVDEG